MKSYKYICLIFALLGHFSIAAQPTKEWTPVHINSLQFSALFYGAPISTNDKMEKEICHRFENRITDSNHPNISYSIQVWESTDTDLLNYTTDKEAKLINDKLLDKELKLINKGTMNKGVVFKQFLFENPKEEYIHFYTGIFANRVYCLEIHCRKDEGFNMDVVQFLRSFQLDLPPTQEKEITMNDLSYTIHFPYTPTIKETESTVPSIKRMTLAYAESPKKEVEVEVEMLYPGSQPEKSITYVSTDSVSLYLVSETLFTEEVSKAINEKTKNLLYQQSIQDILNSNSARLIDQENIRHNDLEGVALMIRNAEETQIYHLFITRKGIYVLQANLAYMAKPNCRSVTQFMHSFSLK